jgi:hypothetical protein
MIKLAIADVTLSWCRLRCPAWAARYTGPALRKMSATSSEVRIALNQRAALFVLGLEVRHFRHTQASAIGGAERCPVLDPRCRLEQLCCLIDA